MEFRIADTFTDSLARLPNEEQKLVKTTAFDLQVNPAQPGMQLHKLDKARDPRFWSIRVTSDVRLILHRTETSLLLCYVGHHDDAYRWAERRKLETHPHTGAAQLVEIRERVEEIVIPKYIEAAAPPPLQHYTDAQLLSYGVPAEWLADVRQANEDHLLEVAEHLPREAAEAVLTLATGVTPPPTVPVAADTDPFAHPDALRRFRIMRDIAELERALTFPWDKWTIFLHPAQQQMVAAAYHGPVRVSGSAGTGKTIIALHRAAYVARTYPAARILLTTFSDPLAHVLRGQLRALISNTPQLAERLEVHALNAIAQRLYTAQFGAPAFASEETQRQILTAAASAVTGHQFTAQFVWSEWAQVVDAWQLATWEAYRAVPRLGRKTRLPEKQRALLWAICADARMELRRRNLLTWADLFAQLTARLQANSHPPFDFLVVDEAQDVSVAQMRWLAAMGAARPDSLFFTGDLGQRIFQPPFSWKDLGIELRGRARTLRVNYRTSHQIRTQADRLLAPEMTDVDGNLEARGAVSVFNGPLPQIDEFDSPAAESQAVGQWLAARTHAGVQPHEIGVFVRSAAELERARAAVAAAGLTGTLLDETVAIVPGQVAISVMHLVKGLEFRAVAVMACDDEVIPLQVRLASVAEEADLAEVYNTERHLLYVACTRARDHLLVSGVKPVSEFLDDLRGA